MRAESAIHAVESLPRPHVNRAKGRWLYELVRRSGSARLLELGTGRGGSTAYLAAALEEDGAGHVTTVDSSGNQWASPTAAEFLASVGLREHVTLVRSDYCYTWTLQSWLLRPGSEEVGGYDGAFIDGAKRFPIILSSLVLCSQLVRPGGWIVLDDVDWTYASYSETPLHYGLQLSLLSYDELVRPHVGHAVETFRRLAPAVELLDAVDGLAAMRLPSQRGLRPAS